MKRICFFVGCMSQGGGTEHMTQLVANMLAKQKYEIFVLSKKDKEGTPFYPLNDNIRYDVLNNKPYRGPKSILEDILILRNYLKYNRIDILVCADVALGLFAIPASLCMHRMKLIFWDHFNVNYDVENKRMHHLRKAALRFGDYYITLTPEDKEDIQKNNKKCCRIVNIPNICMYDLSKTPYNINSKCILSAGNMLNVKGFDMAIEVASIVSKQYPEWQWHIYGDGPELDNLKKLVVNKQLSSFVKFKGRVKSLKEAYENAAFFVMTSRSEGFGLVIAEAQSFHLPVVAFDVPYGPRNLIDDKNNGILVEPFNVKHMAKEVIRLIEDKELRLLYSQNAAVRFDDFSEEKILIEWINVIEDE